MALPTEWATRTVERIYKDWDGEPLSGTVTFRADVAVETMDENEVYIPRTITGTLDGAGKLSVILPVTDDEDMRNHSFTYTVTERLHLEDGTDYEPTPYHVQIASGEEPDPEDWPALQLGTLAPIPSGAGVVVVGGIPGKSAYDVAKDNGFVGTEAAWLASLVGPASIQPGPTGPSIFDVWKLTHPAGTFEEFMLELKGPEGDPGDVSGLAAVATTGRATDLDTTDWGYSMLVGERQTEDILANRVMLQVRYTGSAYESAIDTTRLCRVFTGPDDPGSAANEDDLWLVLPT